jgi:LacI family transcriptional regulator
VDSFGVKTLTTLKEVARKAGVSVSTVSRVVNGYEHVSDEVRRRVNQAIHELNYQPNLLAKALVSGKDTRQIGLLIYDVSNAYYAEIAGAVENVAYQSGYSVILCNSSKGRNTTTYLQTFIQRQVDCVAIATGQLEESDVRCLERLIERNIPIVISRERHWSCNHLLEPFNGKISFIDLDYYSGARLAAEYLISLGHEQIALLCGLPEEEFSEDPRIKGIREVLQAYNLSLDPDLVVKNLGFNQTAGARGMLELLSRKKPFSAVIAYNDLLAIGALAILREEGFRVPQDISVMGFDNVEASQYCYPELTTVDVLISEQGVFMTNDLLAQIKNKRPPMQRRIPAELVVRQSTGVNKGKKIWS